MSIDAEASHRSAFWLSMALTLLGSCGACNGLSNYNVPPIPAIDAMTSDGLPGEREGARVSTTMAAIVVTAPHRRPLALANVLCSAMLIGGGFMLGIRRKSARWFIINAIVANLLWIGADSSISVMQLRGWREPLTRDIARYKEATNVAGVPATPVPDDLVAAGTTALMIGAVLKIAVHLGVLWAARRPAVTAFLEQPPEA